MSSSAAELLQELQHLKQQRKEKTLSLREYYRHLLALMSRLATSLQDEVEDLTAEEVAYQTPVVLLFLEEQIRKFDERFR